MKVITLVASLLSLAAYASVSLSPDLVQAPKRMRHRLTDSFSTAQSPACPTTITTINPRLNLGPTSTTYLSTVTSTSSVDCGGCADVVVTSLRLGPGPRASFTTTVTAPESTTTSYVCSE